METKEINVTTKTLCSHSSTWLPFDLTRQILMHLPSISLMRFRCVSKLWSSVTCDQDFVTSFTSHSRPCLLLSFSKIDKQLFFSLSQRHVAKYPLNIKEESRYGPMFQFQSVHGLVSFHYFSHVVIWNPSTGQHSAFQKPTIPVEITKSYLGYEPIENTYKLLCMDYCKTNLNYVLTLGVQESWRRINNVNPVRDLPIQGICINGVLYYIVRNVLAYDLANYIMSFDVRTEKFKLIQTPSYLHGDPKPNLSLVSYKGRLGWVILKSLFYKLWVLEDVENEEWSCQDFQFPFSPYDPVAKVDYFLSNVTNDGEIVYVSVSWHDRVIHISYYDPKKESYKRVKIDKFDQDDECWLRNRIS